MSHVIKELYELLIRKFKVSLNSTTGEVVIHNVTFEDRGRYTCTATNLLGSSQGFVEVYVRGKDWFAFMI